MIFDRFHVQRLSHDALDKVRREQVRELVGTDDASSVKKTRFALQKNPWNLSQSDHEKLADVQRSNRSSIGPTSSRSPSPTSSIAGK